jgi:RHS repeat-associated protein
MQMPVRNLTTSNYRFGYTGKEVDPEMKGQGNSYDFGARQYDPRLGRWLSLDPLKHLYSQMSPYCYAGNMPIAALDPDGNLIIFVNGYTGEKDVETFGVAYYAFNTPIKHGKEYWHNTAEAAGGYKSSEFLDAATTYFDGDDRHYFVNGDSYGGSTAEQRKAIGKAAVTAEVLTSIREALEEGEEINFVTHSMGGAYAEGMIEAMMADEVIKEAIEKGKILHLSTCDAADLKIAANTESLYRVQLQMTGDKTLNQIGADNTTPPTRRKTEGVTIFGAVQWTKDKYFPGNSYDIDAHYSTKAKAHTFDMIRDLESFRSQSSTFSKWKVFESGGKKYKNVVLDLEGGTIFLQIDYAGFKWKGKGIVGDGKGQFTGQQKFTREVNQ